MPETEVIFFADDGSAPMLEWLKTLPEKVQDKCIVRVERLQACGHELRRPEADYLRDGVYELRVKHQRVNYRMLYFFHEKTAVLSHGCRKESKVPEKEIDLTVQRRIRFKADPKGHSYQEVGDV